MANNPHVNPQGNQQQQQQQQQQQAPVPPPAPAPPQGAQGLWQCHECGGGPNVQDVEARCISCPHIMCGQCPRDNSIPSTLGPVMQAQPRKGIQISAPIPPLTTRGSPGSGISAGRVRSPAGTPQIPATLPDRSNYGRRVASSQPPTRGWWYCHMCTYHNNPALSPQVCFNCGHSKCAECYTMRRGVASHTIFHPQL